MLPNIIGLGYKKNSGKDTVADYLVEKYGYQKMSFAKNLKAAAGIIFGLTHEQMNDTVLKEVTIPTWQKTPRELLQILGEALRQVINADVWVNSLYASDLKEMSAKDKLVFTDVRHHSEAEMLIRMGGELWRIDRHTPQNEFSGHISETALDSFNKWDHVISNNDSKDNLYYKVDSILGSFGGRF